MRILTFEIKFILFFTILFSTNLLFCQINEFEIPTTITSQDTVLKISKSGIGNMHNSVFIVEDQNLPMHGSIAEFVSQMDATFSSNFIKCTSNGEIVSRIGGQGNGFFKKMAVGSNISPLTTLEVFVEGDDGILITGGINSEPGYKINTGLGLHRLYNDNVNNDFIVETNNDFRINSTLGSTSMLVKNDGMIGIGEEDPLSRLHINSTAAEVLSLQSSNLPILQFFKSGSVLPSDLAWMQFQTNQFRFANNASDSGFDFWVTNDVGSSSPAMTIKGSSNVGIGTTDPAVKLSINSNDDEVLRLTSLNDPELSLYRNSSTNISQSAKIQLDAGNINISNNIAGGRIDFKTNTIFTTTKMSLTNSGDLGIGTLTPDRKLHLNVSSSDGILLEGDGTNSVLLEFKNNFAGGSHFLYTDPVNDDIILQSAIGQNVILKAKTNNDLVVTPGNGYVGINKDSPEKELHVGGDAEIDGELVFNDDIHSLYFKHGGFYRIETNADITPESTNVASLGAATKAWKDVFSFNYTTVSDKRVKNNIEKINYGLKDVLKINPVQYKLNIDASHKTQLGVIAQEIKEIIPEIVTHSSDNKRSKSKEDLYAVNYQSLIPVLINAIQELNAEVEALKKKIE